MNFLMLIPLVLALEATSVESLSIAQILSTGMVGVFLLMLIFRVKIQPTYVYDDAKKEWERERVGLEKDLDEARNAIAQAQQVYVDQVIPTLTRVLDSERELVELRKAEDRRSRGT